MSSSANSFGHCPTEALLQMSRTNSLEVVRLAELSRMVTRASMPAACRQTIQPTGRDRLGRTATETGIASGNAVAVGLFVGCGVCCLR